MPSPIGHALGGIAAGWAAAPRHDRIAAWTLAAIGAAADLDLLFHAHRGPSHSLGAAAIVGVVVWCACAVTPLRRNARRWAIAAAAAWASHVLLDWVGEDTWPPIGIPALWPFSRAYYQSPIVIFPSVSRQYWRHWDFVAFNLKALAVELVVLLPIVWIVVRARRGRHQYL
jgi:membrane-bound metal-dependent hydrolase YbcI (DUF457 family)